MKKERLSNALFFILILFFGCTNVEQQELNKGKSAFDMKDYKKAIEHFKKALKENYQNSEAYLLIGRAYLEMEGDNYNSAISYLEKSLKYNPKNPEAFVYLGDAYLWKHYNYTFVDEKAIENYQKAINLNPNYALPYYRIGSAYGFRKNQIDEAFEWYKKGVSIDDNYTRVYLHLGELYYKKNDLNEATIYYKKEINRDPSSLESYFKLSQCYLAKKDFTTAVDYLNILAQKILTMKV